MPDKGDFIFISKLVLGSPTDSKQFKGEGLRLVRGMSPVETFTFSRLCKKSISLLHIYR